MIIYPICHSCIAYLNSNQVTFFCHYIWTIWHPFINWRIIFSSIKQWNPSFSNRRFILNTNPNVHSSWLNYSELINCSSINCSFNEYQTSFCLIRSSFCSCIVMRKYNMSRCHCVKSVIEWFKIILFIALSRSPFFYFKIFNSLM